MTKISIEEVISNAISEMDYETLDKVLLLDSNKEWSDSDWENYNKVVRVIVEPESFVEHERYSGRVSLPDDDLDYYHELGEDELSRANDKQWYYIRNIIAGSLDSEKEEKLSKLCKLILVTGY